MTKRTFYLIATFILAMLTLGGLGNAAIAVDKIYWVPFVLDAIYFVAIFVRLWKDETKDNFGV